MLISSHVDDAEPGGLKNERRNDVRTSVEYMR